MKTSIAFLKRVAGMRCTCKPMLRIMHGKPQYKLAEKCLPCEARSVAKTVGLNAQRKRSARVNQLALPL